MGFYEEFIEKYDSLISWKNRSGRETKFFKKLLSENKVEKVLDCACGTGQHVVMLNQMGFSAKGSDLSPAMIKKAKTNAKKYGVKATFKVADFRNLSKTFNEKFDAIICMGNSLPHLFNNRDLTKALNEMHKLLNKNGILIMQQRNYDMLVGKKKRFFPMSIRKDEVFFYVLDYFPDKVVFNVVNLENKSGKFNVYSTNYNPLKKSHISELLRKSGFKNLKFFGNYKFKRFNIRSDDYLIFICEK
jgi:ubiquinone/menaquinone biosynthesis C-methylase UbiE